MKEENTNKVDMEQLVSHSEVIKSIREDIKDVQKHLTSMKKVIEDYFEKTKNL